MNVNVLRSRKRNRPTIEQELAELYGGIDTVRRRTWQLAWMRALRRGSWIWIVTLLLLGSVAAFLPMPMVVRAALLTVHLLLIAAAVWSEIRASAIRGRAIRDWALRCEELEPGLKNRLVTCVELATDNGGKDIFESSPVANALLEETTRVFRRFDPEHAVPGRRIRNAATAALFPALIFVAMYLYSPTATSRITGGLYDMRGFSFAGHGWKAPARTLAKFDLSPGDVEIPRGRSVAIQVTSRVSPSATETLDPPVLSLMDSDGAVQTRSMPRDESSDLCVYKSVIQNVRALTRYEVTFAGEKSALFAITPFDPPTVKSIVSVVTPPDYVGQSPKRIEGPYIPALTSSTLEITLTSDRPLHSARLVGDGGIARTAAIDNKTARFTFSLNASVSLRAEITDTSNHRNTDPPLIQLVAENDEPPAIRVSRPGADWSVHRIAEVVLEAEASDDNGLRDFTLEYRLNDQDPVRVEFLRADDATTPPLSRTATHTFVLEDLNLAEGDSISYRLIARDRQASNNKATGYSQPYFLTIRPFEQAYYKGGPTAGGAAMSATERDVIVATLRLVERRHDFSSDEFRDNSTSISRTQRTVRTGTERLRERLKNARDIDNLSERLKHLDKAIDDMTRAEDLLAEVKPDGALPFENSALRHVSAATAGLPLAVVWDAGSQPSPFLPDPSMSLAGQRVEVKKDKYELNTPRQSNSPNPELLKALEAAKALARRQKEFLETIKREKMEGNTGGASGMPSARFEDMRTENEDSRYQLERLHDEIQDLESLDPEQMRRLAESLEKVGVSLADLDRALRTENSQEAETAAAKAAEEVLQLQMNLQRARDTKDTAALRELRNEIDALASRQEALEASWKDASSQDSAEAEALRKELAERQRELREAAQQTQASLESATASSATENRQGLQRAQSQMQDASAWMEKAVDRMQADESYDVIQSQASAHARLQNARQTLDRLLGDSPANQMARLEQALDTAEQLRARLRESQSQQGQPEKKGRSQKRSDSRGSGQGKNPGDQKSGDNASSPKGRDSQSQGQQGQAQPQASGGSGRNGEGSPSNAPPGTLSELNRADGAVAPSPRSPQISPREIHLRIRALQNLLQEDPEFTSVLRQMEQLNQDLRDRGYTEPEVVDIQVEMVVTLEQLEELIRRRLSLADQRQRLRMTPDDAVSPRFRGMAWKYFEELSRANTPERREP